MAVLYLGICELHAVEILPLIIYQQDLIMASLQFVLQCLRDEVNKLKRGGRSDTNFFFLQLIDDL
jgi:hypothetical protein